MDLVCPWPGCGGLAYMYRKNTDVRRFRCERCERRFTIRAADYHAGLVAAGWAEAEPETATASVVLPDSAYYPDRCLAWPPAVRVQGLGQPI